jgi:hypothetical protein
MQRREVLVSAAVGPLLTGCLWPRFFDLNWDEEVQLQEQRQVVVKLKLTFERVGGSLSLARYAGSILRDTTIRFDAGSPNGVVTQLFKGFWPVMLDQAEGKWYAVLTGGHYGNSWHVPGQDWGTPQNFAGQRVAQLIDGHFEPVSIRQLPAAFTVPNMLLLYAPTQELASFDRTRVTLARKASYLERYPRGPGDITFERPQAPGTR